MQSVDNRVLGQWETVTEQLVGPGKMAARQAVNPERGTRLLGGDISAPYFLVV